MLRAQFKGLFPQSEYSEKDFELLLGECCGVYPDALGWRGSASGFRLDLKMHFNNAVIKYV